jgi:hypothetical protein
MKKIPFNNEWDLRQICFGFLMIFLETVVPFIRKTFTIKTCSGAFIPESIPYFQSSSFLINFPETS